MTDEELFEVALSTLLGNFDYVPPVKLVEALEKAAADVRRNNNLDPRP